MGWTSDELNRIGDAEELRIAPSRPDGSLYPPVIIWVARVADGLYVRSARGPRGSWYRHAIASRVGRIDAGGVEKTTDFVSVSDTRLQHEIDSAYRAKYASAPVEDVEPVVGSHSYEVTIRLVPRAD
jgi:hypothetical protein